MKRLPNTPKEAQGIGSADVHNSYVLREETADRMAEILSLEPHLMRVVGENRAQKERDYYWRRLPPLVRRFQWALVKPENWIGFDSDSCDEKTVRKLSSQIIESISLDSSKVSETTLVSLGILEKEIPKSAPEEQRELLLQEATDSLRRVFMHASSIPWSQRIYEIHDPKFEDTQKECPWNGKFLVFQDTEALSDAPKRPKRNTPEKISDISFSAYASMYHVVRGMRHSIDSMRTSNGEIARYVLEFLYLLNTWRDKESWKLRAEISAIIRELQRKTTHEIINAVENRLKAITHSHAQLDTSRIVWVINDLKKASVSKSRKTESISEQEMKMIGVIEQQEKDCTEFCFGIFPRITSIAKMMGTDSVSRDSSFFHPKNIKTPLSLKERKSLGMPLEYSRKYLDKIEKYSFSGRPFRPFSDRLAEIIEAYDAYGSSWSREEFIRTIEILEFRTKLFLAYSQALRIQDMIKGLPKDAFEKTPELYESMNRQLQIIQEIVSKRYFFPNIPYHEPLQKKINKSLKNLHCHEEGAVSSTPTSLGS